MKISKTSSVSEQKNIEIPLFNVFLQSKSEQNRLMWCIGAENDQIAIVNLKKLPTSVLNRLLESILNKKIKKIEDLLTLGLWNSIKKHVETQKTKQLHSYKLIKNDDWMNILRSLDIVKGK
jgi:hypothetical protein